MTSQQIIGISFGLKRSIDTKFKELRRSQNIKIKKNLENIFDIDNITVPKSSLNDLNKSMKKSKSRKRSSSAKSVRELVKLRKENLKNIRFNKRNKRLNRVLDKQEDLILEREKKNEKIKSKYQYEYYTNRSLSQTKLGGGNFGIISDNSEGEIDNENNNNDQIEDSYTSDQGFELDKKTKYLNERYNIEVNRIRNTNKGKREVEVRPGPCNKIFLYLVLKNYFFL